MPTGYTAEIESGMSFESFIMGCARAFGAYVTMRDEPNNAKIKKFEPSSYHIDRFNDAKKELSKLEAMSQSSIKNEIEKEHKSCIASSEESINKIHELRCKYDNMLANVNAWDPPTAEHQGLKDFMISQINESINWDCGTGHINKPIKKTENEWITKKINQALHDLEYHKKEYAKEVNRVNSRNLWINQLKKSIKNQH